MGLARRRRGVVLFISSMLLFRAVTAVPAEAKKKPKKCPAFTPWLPESESGEAEGALEAEVIEVTDQATAEAPIVVEYEHGPAFWVTQIQQPIVEDTVFFNLQVQSASPAPALYIFQEWAKRPGSDMDLLLYEKSLRVALSGSHNVLPEPTPSLPINRTGGWGLESIAGFATANCAGYTVESRAFRTAGEAMTLSLWLGEPAPSERLGSGRLPLVLFLQANATRPSHTRAQDSARVCTALAVMGCG